MSPPLVQFAELCERLAGTGSKLEKRGLMAEYLRALPVREAGLAALYLAGTPFAETDGRELKVGGALLTRVIAQLSGASQPAMHAAYLRHGDLGGAAQDLLQGQGVVPSLELAEVAEAFAAIAGAAKPAAKQQLTLELLRKATPLEAKYLIKIILGDMRTGTKVSLVEEAIAAAYGSAIGEVRQARMLNGNLPEVLELAAGGRLAEARMKLFHPLGFMLASPVETVEEALQRFSDEVTAEGQAEGPIIKEAQLEDKYDGVRAQIHCGSPEHPGRVAIFSRSREDMTPSFPELVEAFAGFEEPLVLDGEILAWSPGNDLTPDRALPFASLQGRLGRKRVTREMRETTPVVFMAFDMLCASGQLMMERPLLERRLVLEALVQREQLRTMVASHSSSGQQGELHFGPDSTDSFARLVLAPAVQLQSVAQLEQACRCPGTWKRRRDAEGPAQHLPARPARPGVAQAEARAGHTGGGGHGRGVWSRKTGWMAKRLHLRGARWGHLAQCRQGLLRRDRCRDCPVNPVLSGTHAGGLWQCPRRGTAGGVGSRVQQRHAIRSARQRFCAALPAHSAHSR
jgi:DNA ligase-1